MPPFALGQGACGSGRRHILAKPLDFLDRDFLGLTGRARYMPALASIALFLSACSGGGGSVATPAPATLPPVTQTAPTSGIALNLQPPSTTVTYQAAAATATNAVNQMSNVSLSALGQGATITLTADASGNLSGVGIPAGGISLNGFSITGSSLTNQFSGMVDIPNVICCSNSIGYGISQAAAGQGLTSSAYGLWASTLRNSAGDAGALAFGNLTPAASVPTTGSATFNGFTVGVGAVANGPANYSLRGNAQIIANFATQSVTTNLTNFIAGTYGASASIPDLTGTSSMAGNAYAGAIAGGNLTGTINGNFYGSSAQETTGVWQVSGGGNAWIGSYGAK